MSCLGTPLATAYCYIPCVSMFDMETTCPSWITCRAHSSPNGNAKINLLLNLGAEAETSGFPEYAQYLLRDTFLRLEQKLEQKKLNDHCPLKSGS